MGNGGEGAPKVTAARATATSARREVDIRGLKTFIATKFGSRSLIRRVMLVEPDLIPAAEVVGKVGTWLAVLEEDLEDRP